MKLKLKLSKKDIKVLFDGINKPSKPNKALKKAVIKYKKNGIKIKTNN
jgi:hypothetical protein